VEFILGLQGQATLGAGVGLHCQGYILRSQDEDKQEGELSLAASIENYKILSPEEVATCLSTADRKA